MAERVARNDAIFRDANESISNAAREYGVDGGVPFICECADPACTEIVRVPLDDYSRIRSDSTWFVNAPGHHVAAQGHARVVEHRDGYEVVEKLGAAAAKAAELDSREA